LGVVLSQQGDRNGARGAFRKALQLDPGNAAARENLDAAVKQTASTEMPFGKSAGTGPFLMPRISTGELAPNIDGDDLDQIKSFEASIGQDKIDDLEPLVVRYLKDHPNSWRAHYIQGFVLFRTRKFGDSIGELAKSLELNADNPEAHKILGRDFVVIGQFDYAQTELQQAVRLKPESAEIHFSLGEIYSVKDMVPEAKAEFTAAIQRDAMYAEAYDGLGLTEESLENDTAALEDYKKAIEIADQKGLKFDAPYINLSAYYNRFHKPDLALQYARKAIKLDPNNDLGYYQMGRAYQTLGQLDQAAEALRSAISDNPVSAASAQYYYVLSQVYRKLGQEKESAVALDRFLELKRAADLVDKKLLENRRLPASDSGAANKQ